MTGHAALGGAPREHPIVTLCGSMRLHQDMLTVAAELTRQGRIVLLPLPIGDDRSLHCPSRITDDELAALHRAKIDMADLVVIVTKEMGYLFNSTSRALYFGDSTTAEWAYAKSLGKATTGVRVERRAYRDTVIWIDDLDLGNLTAAGERSSVSSAVARPRAAGRRSARREPARVVSARTFRIG